jgi:hypothetical protein
MTPTELHEAMIKAAMEAYDRTFGPGVTVSYSPEYRRMDYLHRLRERLAQVANSVGIEMTLAYERGVETGREDAYCEAEEP